VTDKMIDKVRRLSTLSSRCGLSLCDWLRLRYTERYQAGHVSLLGIDFSYVDAASLLSGLSEIFVQQCYKFQAQAQSPLIIDCGANVGLSVFYFKRLYPLSRIQAFEADPKIFETLRSNVAEAKFDNVLTNNRAVWISNDPIEFRSEGGYSGRVAMTGDDSNISRVNGIRLRDLLEESVDMLKVDIEGAENKVIVDCADRLHNVSTIFLEYHSHQHAAQQLDEILRVLKEAGLRYFIKEAFASEHPFMDRTTLDGMDLQLNIFAYR